VDVQGIALEAGIGLKKVLEVSEQHRAAALPVSGC
jgi:hypothetical protein